jgi:two-component system chemotaxis sensor kinase CheA
MQKIANLAHDLESLMDNIRNSKVAINLEIVECLISSGDVLSQLVDDLVNEGKERTSIAVPLERISSLLESGSSAEPPDDSKNEPDFTQALKEEEYDEELYVIFVQNLREGLTDCNRIFSRVKSGKTSATVLDECLGLIGSLEASANYMGYDQLASIYDDLKDDMEGLKKDTSDPISPSLIEEATEKIQGKIGKICDLFDIDTTDIGLPNMLSEENPPLGNDFPTDFPDEEAVKLEIDNAFFGEGPAPQEAVEIDEGVAEMFKDIEKDLNTPDSPDFYEEAYDSELFDIFVQQLEEDFEWYKTDAEMLVAADDPGETPSETIARWKNKLGSLKSNANYMGYDKLSGIYRDWENRLNAIEDDLTKGEPTNWQKELLSNLTSALESVCILFPKADQLKKCCIEEEPVLPEIEESFSGVDEFGEVEPIPNTSSLLNDALRDKISKMPVHAETPHEVVSDFLFTDDSSFNADASDVNTASSDLEMATEALASKKKEPAVDTVRTAERFRDGTKIPVADNSFAQEGSAASSGIASAQKESEIDSEEEPQGENERASVADPEKASSISQRIRSQSIRVDANKIDALMNQVGELVVSRAWFSQLHHEMRDLKQELSQEKSLDKRLAKQISQMTFRLHEATSSLGRAANELQEGVMRIRMLPVARLFNRYPRLIHDLVKEGDKKVDLEIRGEDTELDKMVIEKISDPMIHIIRNAIDHGVENSSERKRAGKPKTAKLIVEAYHESNHVVIEVTDDGRGIDPQKIKAKILEKKLLEAVELERMVDREILSLIMKPGFSTAEKVTHTSGRGVGMDVVKKNIEKLNGTVEIDSTTGKETRIRIKIPLTLAIIPALLVRVEAELFTIPLSTVEETIKVNPKDIESIEGNEVIYLRDQTIPLIRLNRVFNMSSTDASDDSVFIVIVSNGMNQMGLVVDAMLGQEEVVIKPLEDYLQESSGFSGATILGDGRISLILDIYDLLNISMAKMEYRRKTSATAFE